MSFEDWQRGVKAGLEQEVEPVIRQQNHAWHKACLEIIQRCVAPDMYPQAMEMLYRARVAADGGSQNAVDIPKMENQIPKLASATWNRQ